MNRSWLTLLIGMSIIVLVLGISLRHINGHSTQTQNTVKVGFAVGDRAPDFALPTLDSRSVRLSALRGHPVLLNFWATWCAPCRVEMPWLVELDQKYRTQGLQIVGVSLDEAGDVKEVASFAKQRGVQYQLLLGNSATADAYGGVRFMPQTFFIDSEGKITKATTGITNKNDFEEGVKALLVNDGHSQLAQEGRR